MGLEIRKQSSKVWLHVPSDGDNFIFSKFYCKAVGEKFRVVEFGGSILKEYDVTEVSVYDIGGSEETFSTANELMQRLEALGYNGFFTDGEVTPSTLISTDVDNALEVGTDNKLFVPQAGGVQSVTGSMVDNTDAENPIIQSDSTKENAITAGTTSQYFRGDKTFQTLDKTAVGLSNVDNTSDANKPISTAAQTALNNKLDKVSTVDVEKVYIKNADGTQGVKATSELNDVLEFANLASFPATGESGKIYVALDTNYIYRWSGSAYIVFSATPALPSNDGKIYGIKNGAWSEVTVASDYIITMHHPSWNCTTQNQWRRWQVNASSILAGSDNGSIGTGITPDSSIYYVCNVLRVTNKTQLKSLTLSLRQSSSAHTIQLYVESRNFKAGSPGFETNSQVLINESFTVSDGYTKSDFTINNHTLNANSVIYFFFRRTSATAANNIFGVQLDWKFQ